MNNVVVVGGGKGQSALLRGIKMLDKVNVSTIVSVTDDGGSTGRLREFYNIPAIGDVRNVMMALSDSSQLMSDIMNYRFDKSSRSELANHSLGNLVLTAMIDIEGSFMGAVNRLSEALNIQGHVYPSTVDMVRLCARMSDGTIVRGESNIPAYQNHIEEVFYDVSVKATEEAISAIEAADLVILGIGSLYTSILPNLIIPEIKAALALHKVPIVYYCNAMTQPGETEHYTGEDHVIALEQHMGVEIDYVIRAQDQIDGSILDNYAKDHSYPVEFVSENHHYQLISLPLLSVEDGVIRHDSLLVKESLEFVKKEILCRLAQK